MGLGDIVEQAIQGIKDRIQSDWEAVKRFMAAIVQMFKNEESTDNETGTEENENTQDTEAWEEEECIDEIRCQEDDEDGTPCSCNALVTCTSAPEGETKHIVKEIDGETVKIADITVLEQYDIEIESEFKKCKLSLNGLCALDREYIVDQSWQDLYNGLAMPDGKGVLDAERSFMICTYGIGCIHFKNDGQVISNCAEEILFEDLSDDEILFVTTIYGESAACSIVSGQCIANVIMNRCGYREWREYGTPEDIIENTGFDAYNNPNAPFIEAQEYFKNRDYTNAKIEQLIQAIMPIYRGEVEDVTQGAVLYYSPEAQQALHQQYPKIYPEKPNWDFSQLEEIMISGMNDDFKFYRYK